MSTPYVGEIRMAGFNFAPVDWELCDGQLLSIAENNTLFNLIGTTFGGDGQNTFALPDLRGRIPFHMGTFNGNSLVIGQIAGTEDVTLTQGQIPIHAHSLGASSGNGTQVTPQGGVWAASPLDQFSNEVPTGTMGPTTFSATGGSQPHDNMPPFQVVNFIISLFGIYPTQG